MFYLEDFSPWMIIVWLAIYIVTVWPMYRIANRLNTKNAWLVWIPIANVFVFVEMARKAWWWAVLILLLPLIPLVGVIVSLVMMIMVLWKIVERMGWPGVLSIVIAIVPLVNIILLYVIAYGNRPIDAVSAVATEGVSSEQSSVNDGQSQGGSM